MPESNRPLYLDYNATTPLDRRVLEAMLPWFCEQPGNAGSRTHVFGQRAKDAVERARNEVARLIDAQPEEIIFTSGATESNNIALLGLAEYGIASARRHIVSTAIEHKALLEPLEHLSRHGFEIELVPVGRGGFVEPGAIKVRLRADTLLVSVMHANNETGVLQPVEQIAQLLEGSATLFHTDAAQTFGKEVETLKRLRCDLMSISAHKVYGPKGVGALYLRQIRGAKRKLQPLFFGGGQERGLRPGTIPVPLIVGLGEAAKLAGEEFRQRQESAATVKARLLEGLRSTKHQINGELSLTQPHVINICFTGVDSEALMLALRDELAISNGSACTSSSYQPSHVLKAMGLDDDAASSSVRLSWGPPYHDIPTDRLVAAVSSLRL